MRVHLRGQIGGVKRKRPYDGGASKGKFEIRDKPKFKTRFSNKVILNLSKDHKDKVSNPWPLGEKGGHSKCENPNCTKC